MGEEITGEISVDAFTAYSLDPLSVENAEYFRALHEKMPHTYVWRLMDIYQELRCADIERERALLVGSVL